MKKAETGQNHEVRTQNGIPVGNVVDKSNLRNPLARFLVSRFDSTLFCFAQKADPAGIHEVGCGEGRVTRELLRRFNVPIRATDFSTEIIRHNMARGDLGITYLQKSIYDLDPDADSADLVVCCEVMEHLEDPDTGLEALKSLRARHYILSVPREPVWRILNMLRGQYLGQWGNTPGHLNHWSGCSFSRFLRKHRFRILHKKQPLPWTMVMGVFED